MLPLVMYRNRCIKLSNLVVVVVTTTDIWSSFLLVIIVINISLCMKDEVVCLVAVLEFQQLFYALKQQDDVVSF